MDIDQNRWHALLAAYVNAGDDGPSFAQLRHAGPYIAATNATDADAARTRRLSRPSD